MRPTHFVQIICKGRVTSIWRATRWGRVIVIFFGHARGGGVSVSLPLYDRQHMQLIPLPKGADGWRVTWEEAIAKAPAVCLKFASPALLDQGEPWPGSHQVYPKHN